MEDQKEQNDLLKMVENYENKFVTKASQEHSSEWKKLKGKIEEMLQAEKAPYISKNLELPIILLATPEIVSLPPNMGNLANHITTGDGGGLADISAALVAELDRQGINVHVALPEYRNLFFEYGHISPHDYDEMYEENRIHLISDGILGNAKKVYGDASKGLDNIDLRRADAFMRGVIYRVLTNFKSKKVLVHCNDWMTGLIPAAAKKRGIRSLMTFHNIFTYHQTPKMLYEQGIDVEPFWKDLFFRKAPDQFGSYEDNYEENEVDFMLSGLKAADFINTVSPTFLKEVVENYFFEHEIIPQDMHEIIQLRYFQGLAAGILNAPSLKADAEKDPLIPVKYGLKPKDDCVSIFEGKRRNKISFQKEMGLQVDRHIPLFLWPSRIASPQKGFELLLEIIPGLMDHYGRDNIQIAVVANGDPRLISLFQHLAQYFPGLSYRKFDRALSQMGKAGSDFLLMPSLYEPCGTPQVEGPRYATLPIVRRTGGLADTVEHLSHDGLIGNGFVFEDFIGSGLWFGVTQALDFYWRGEAFRDFVHKRVMRESFERFNIYNTAKNYIEIYQEIFDRHDSGVSVI